jgi:hypothetical protein
MPAPYTILSHNMSMHIAPCGMLSLGVSMLMPACSAFPTGRNLRYFAVERNRWITPCTVMK